MAGALGLYNVPNPLDRAQGFLNSAASSYAAMDKSGKTEVEAPGKTLGGAGSAAAGGALAGASYGAMEGTKINPGWGTVIGAVAGGLFYALS